MQTKQNTKPLPLLIKIAFGIASLSMLAVIFSIAGYRLGWWRQTEAFNIFEWASYTALLTIIISIISMIKNNKQNITSKVLWALPVILLSFPIVTMSALFEFSAKVYPPINDISTDVNNPPSFWDVDNPVEYPGEATAKQQLSAYPDLKSVLLPSTVPNVFDQALALAIENNWEIVSGDSEEAHIEAVESSLLFGFKDEIAIQIVAVDQGAKIDVRSRSRIGRIDRGVNARRIRHFLDELKEKVSDKSV